MRFIQSWNNIGISTKFSLFFENITENEKRGKKNGMKYWNMDYFFNVELLSLKNSHVLCSVMIPVQVITDFVRSHKAVMMLQSH